MRAVVCRSYGPPEDLVIEDVDEPVAGPGQLLVQVHAAAVNFPDVLFVAGKYQVRIPPPFIPGNEIAGEVIAVGDGASFGPGQRVSGTTFGAFAERALLDAESATLMPDDADFASAAAFGVTYRTAYHALRSTAEVAEGDWVVVLGAAEVTLNGKVEHVHENESIYLPIGATHRLANPGKIDLELIEVQTGSYFGEDDIIRIEDDYWRG